ncbi:MAG: hypothetical protein U0822_14500 [Anaerolineae bacterium]
MSTVNTPKDEVQPILGAVIDGRPLAPLTAEEASDIAAARTRWWWVAALSMAVADGLFMVSIADTAGRRGAAWAEPLFWVGLLVLFVPVAIRLALPQAQRADRIALVLLLGVGLYLVKLLHSPVGFTYFDEFIHWRAVNDILASGHLFSKNYLLPVSQHYPVLELVTAAVMNVTGLSIFPAGALVAGVARIILILGLFLFFEQASDSARVASIGALLYMLNPNFIFFGGQFKYESLALALLALVLYTLARRAKASGNSHTRLTIIAALGVVAVTMTHHLTSFALVGFLALWSVVALVLKRTWRTRAAPLDMLALAVVANALWLRFVATDVFGYLNPLLSSAGVEFFNLVAGHPQAPRELFVSSAGVAPLWERLFGLGSVALILLGLLLGYWQIWRTYRSRVVALALAVVALGYPVSLVLRLSGKSWEVGFRAAEFVFIGVAFVLAVGAVGIVLGRRWSETRVLLFSAAAAALLVGAIINGWQREWRLPGPYLPAQETRSVEPQSIDAAQWTRDYLGVENVFGADRTNTSLLATYGGQHVRTSISGADDMGWLLYAEYLGAGQRQMIQQNRLQYMLVDRRLIAAPDRALRYFPDVPVQVAFDKFDTEPHVNRVFDSGGIRIYDLGEISGGP